MKMLTRSVALALAILLCDRPEASEPGPPNIVLIIADDLGWADVGVNNPDCFYSTPELNAFAASGTNFTAGYATSPVCSPSRVSLMTGRDPAHTATTSWFWTKPLRNASYRTATYVNQLPLSERTVAELLRDTGYRTAFFGKWHLGHEADRSPDARGFEHNIGGTWRGAPGKGGYFAPYAPDMPGLSEAPEGEHLPARLTDEAIAWMDRDDDRPFFLTLSYYSVHTPLDGREDLIEDYQVRADKLAYADDERWGDEAQVWPGARERHPTRRVRERQDHAVYAAMVDAMDEHIGRLIDAIDDQGLAHRTLVIFTSDNGGLSTAEGSPTSNLPLRGGKGWLYEGGVRVPLILRWPGIGVPGAAISEPATGADVFATIIDAAGLDPISGDGISLRGVLSNDPPPVPRSIFWHYPHYSNQGGHPGGAIRRGNWKLIQRYEDGMLELFDLNRDIGERSNLIEARPQLANELVSELHAYLRRTDARFLRPKGTNNPWLPPYKQGDRQ
ncbi:MAG: sulfatase [Planctomycetota bacterium]